MPCRAATLASLPSPCWPPKFQTISVRLILNLVNNIFRSTASEFPDSRDLRALLLRIMSCLVHKFGTLQHLIPRIVACEQAKQAQATQRSSAESSIHESITGGGAECWHLPPVAWPHTTAMFPSDIIVPHSVSLPSWHTKTRQVRPTVS